MVGQASAPRAVAGLEGERREGARILVEGGVEEVCLHPRLRGWAAEPGGGVCSEALEGTRKPRGECAEGGGEPGWETGLGTGWSWPSNWTTLTSAPSDQELCVSGAMHSGV